MKKTQKHTKKRKATKKSAKAQRSYVMPLTIGLIAAIFLGAAFYIAKQRPDIVNMLKGSVTEECVVEYLPKEIYEQFYLMSMNFGEEVSFIESEIQILETLPEEEKGMKIDEIIAHLDNAEISRDSAELFMTQYTEEFYCPHEELDNFQSFNEKFEELKGMFIVEK